MAKTMLKLVKKVYKNMRLDYKIRKKYEQFVDRISAGYLLINLPEYSGAFKIDIRSHICKRIFMEGSYEKDALPLIQESFDSNRDAIDIGANVGLYTIWFSKLLGPDHKVLAIEPTKLAYNYLTNNIMRNGIENKVITYKGVVSNRRGKHQIKFIPGLEEYSSLGELTHHVIKGMEYFQEEVDGETLDGLVERFNLKPGFIKVDAEGAEKTILEGSANTLNKYKPVIYSELQDEMLENFQTNSTEVIDMLMKANYKVIDARTRLAISKTKHSGQIMAIPIK